MIFPTKGNKSKKGEKRIPTRWYDNDKNTGI